MQPAVSNLSYAAFAQLSHRLFLGRVLEDTHGFGTATAGYRRMEPAGWTSAQLLHLAAVRTSSSLA